MLVNTEKKLEAPAIYRTSDIGPISTSELVELIGGIVESGYHKNTRGHDLGILPQLFKYMNSVVSTRCDVPSINLSTNDVPNVRYHALYNEKNPNRPAVRITNRDDGRLQANIVYDVADDTFTISTF